MTEPESVKPVLSVPIADLFETQNRQLERIETKLDGKADRLDVRALEARVVIVEASQKVLGLRVDALVDEVHRNTPAIQTLVQQAHASDAVNKYRRFLWGTAVAATGAIGSLLYVLLALPHH